MFRSILSLKTERVISWYMIYELSDHLCAKGGLFFRANKTLKKWSAVLFWSLRFMDIRLVKTKITFCHNLVRSRL